MQAHLSYTQALEALNTGVEVESEFVAARALERPVWWTEAADSEVPVSQLFKRRRYAAADAGDEHRQYKSASLKWVIAHSWGVNEVG